MCSVNSGISNEESQLSCLEKHLGKISLSQTGMEISTAGNAAQAILALTSLLVFSWFSGIFGIFQNIPPGEVQYSCTFSKDY